MALAWLIGLSIAATAIAEQRLGRFITVIDALPEIRRVVFADEYTAYALHAGNPPIVRLAFDDPNGPPRTERLTIAEARRAGAPEELWHPAVGPDHPFWIDPPPGLLTPIAIARDAKGNTLLLDQHDNALHRFDQATGDWTSTGDWGSFPGLFAHPSDVAAVAGRLYIADTRNHRIQVLDDRLSYLGEWGLHIVRPHEDEGHLHYPAGIAVSRDGTLAIVAEPMQDRLQVFGLVRDDDAAGIAEPMFERETIAHFGPHAARDGPLMVTTEPDRPGLIIWDLSRSLPIMIGQIVGQGDEFGRFHSISDVAIQIEGPNGAPRIWALDPAKQRLQVFDLDWSPEKELGFDPFLARFVRAFDLPATLGRDNTPIAGFLLRADGTLLLHNATGGSLVLTDSRLRMLRRINHSHAANAHVRIRPGPDADTIAILNAHTGWLELLRIDGTGMDERYALLDHPDATPTAEADTRHERAFEPRHPFVYSDLLFTGDSKNRRVWVTDRRSHRLLRYNLATSDRNSNAAPPQGHGTVIAPEFVLGLVNDEVPAHPRERLAATLFHKPSGLALDNLGHIMIIDEGNHRIQFIDQAGAFLDAYGARWYTQPARTVTPGRMPR